MTIRVLHVISQLGTGGAQRAVLDMLRHSARYNIESALCVLYGRAEICSPDPVCDRITFLHARPGFANPVNLFRLVRNLRGVFESFRPDIVHSHLRPADMMVAASLAGLPALHFSQQQDTTASLAANGSRPALKRLLTRKLYKSRGTKFIFVSKAVEEYCGEVLGRWDHDSRVIHNSADEDLFFAEPRPAQSSVGDFVFGAAARLAPEKGIDFLIRAFATLSSGAGRPVRLRIAGNGRCEGELRDLAADLDISGSVDFLGRVEDMRGFYNGIDVFVLPSRHSEGFPLAIVEAMFCGRPVIATRVAGASEAIADGETGFLIPVDDPAGMVQAMQAIMQPDTLLRLGKQAEQEARARFSLTGTMTQVADFYRTVLGQSCGGGSLVAGRG